MMPLLPQKRKRLLKRGLKIKKNEGTKRKEQTAEG